MAKLIIYIGILTVFLGIFMYYFSDYLKWFGNLPGDIKINNENINIFIPFTSMLLISILLTVIINFFRRFF